MHIVLATALVRRDDDDGPRVLLVASRYANHPAPLWNLPGGRQRSGELLCETAARECYEETGVAVRVGSLAYLSESYAGDAHVLNATFYAERIGDATPSAPHERDASDHVVAVEWVALDGVASRVTVDVVREPLMACLEGRFEGRYAGFADAGITIEWPSDSA